MTNRKYILVLSGGGAKGAFQVGALKYIFEHGFYHGHEHVPGDQIKFDYIAGISAGSLNAVMVAMDEFKALEKLWVEEIAGHPEKIWTSDFVDENLKPKGDALKKFLPKIGFFKGLGLLISRKKVKRLTREIWDKILSIRSFATNAPLAKRLDELVDIDKIQNTTLRVGYVSLNSGKYHSVKHHAFGGNNGYFKKAILASTAIPIIWPPIDSIPIEGLREVHHQLVDGGIRNVSPLGDIIGDINANFQEDTEYYVVIINNHNGKMEPVNSENSNFLNIAYRSMVDITLNEIFVNDIKEFIRINHLVHKVEDAQQQSIIPNSFQLTNRDGDKVLRKFFYKIIQPEIPMGKTLDFEKDSIDLRIKHGYEIAKKNFAQPVSLFEHHGNTLANGLFQPSSTLVETPSYWSV